MGKLVRDNIPDIIVAQGKNPNTYVASEKEYKQKLYAKLEEEVAEFIHDETSEEIADILEVVFAICEYKQFSFKNIDQIRKEKLHIRGGFKKRIILEN
jgi:predicted house-cleaning noncanonical NTP pyrophosphatase (MazG superfamily)